MLANENRRFKRVEIEQRGCECGIGFRLMRMGGIYIPTKLKPFYSYKIYDFKAYVQNDAIL